MERRFLDAGVQAFAKKSPEQEAQTQRLNTKIGKLSMENELLYEKIARMDEKSPFVFRK